MNQDNVEGAAKEAVGTVKETAGDVTGDKELANQGAFEQVVGAVQETMGDLRDTVAAAVEPALDMARDTVQAGRERYRPAARAVADRMGDQTGLALLAAGVAGFALGWLVASRR